MSIYATDWPGPARNQQSCPSRPRRQKPAGPQHTAPELKQRALHWHDPKRRQGKADKPTANQPARAYHYPSSPLSHSHPLNSLFPTFCIKSLPVNYPTPTSDIVLILQPFRVAMEEFKTTSRRLTKKPPQSLKSHSQTSDSTTSTNISLLDSNSTSSHSQRSSSSLRRAPSAPSYLRSQHQSYAGHARKITSPSPAATYNSSSSSLDRRTSGPSPILAPHELNAPSGQNGAKRYSSPPGRNLLESSSEEFIGAPFDGTGILSQMDSTKASGYQNSLRRPPPPPLSYTSPLPTAMGPPLRQSTSFTSGERINEKIPAARAAEAQLISPKRYSDETKEPKSAVSRKKTGFSGFMNSLVGSPRRINISAPENPVHVTHVGYDNDTGLFTVSALSRDLYYLVEANSFSGPSKRMAAVTE